MPRSQQYLEEGINFFANLAFGFFKLDYERKNTVDKLLRFGGIELVGNHAKYLEKIAIKAGIINSYYAVPLLGQFAHLSDFEAGIQYLLNLGFHFRSQREERLHIERLLRSGGLQAVGEHVYRSRKSIGNLINRHNEFIFSSQISKLKDQWSDRPNTGVVVKF